MAMGRRAVKPSPLSWKRLSSCRMKEGITKMIECCNRFYNGSFSYVLFSSEYFYRHIEFGICSNPACLTPKFKDFKILYNGKEISKIYTGKKAFEKFEQWKKYLTRINNGTKGNQNVYYGDFQKTNKKDDNGNSIYLQLRKNFNEQSEVIGEIQTLVYK